MEQALLFQRKMKIRKYGLVSLATSHIVSVMIG